MVMFPATILAAPRSSHPPMHARLRIAPVFVAESTRTGVCVLFRAEETRRAELRCNGFMCHMSIFSLDSLRYTPGGIDLIATELFRYCFDPLSSLATDSVVDLSAG
jgi:hypothetical protein